MALNPYQNIINSTDFTVFDFVSSGKKEINKRVRFELIDELEQVYNLALCTLLDNGNEDCNTASRNGDMLKVLETVAIVALRYTQQYPKRKIYFTGSDNLRTRQYQLSIFSQLQSMVNYFDIEGLQFAGEIVKLREPFEAGKNYDAFIFTRKAYS
jgi:hypothetical protein